MSETSAPDSRVWSVGALCRAFADTLDARFNPIVVHGELSGFSRASSGHCYFVLKDASGQLRCAMFRRAASLLNFAPRDGDKVEVHARVSVYEPRGDLQLVVEAMQHAGQGNLYEQFIRLKEKLQALGLFEAHRKRPLTPVPRAIGVVTSLGAAALADVATALRRRVPHIPVVLAPALVQGDQAPQALALALQSLYAMVRNPAAPYAIDSILLVRGGGSLEDLWAFNDEQLAHVIAASPVPVVCGVGHETDFTIADFVADVRAPTPTAAAELVAASALELTEALVQVSSRCERQFQRRLEREWQRLDGVAQRLGRPSQMAHQKTLALSAVQQRLQAALQRRLTQAQTRVQTNAVALKQAGRLTWAAHAAHTQALATQLEGHSPQQVLARGYAWLSAADGRPVTRAQGLHAGQQLQATLVDGTVEMVVHATKCN